MLKNIATKTIPIVLILIIVSSSSGQYADFPAEPNDPFVLAYANFDDGTMGSDIGQVEGTPDVLDPNWENWGPGEDGLLHIHTGNAYQVLTDPNIADIEVFYTIKPGGARENRMPCWRFFEPNAVRDPWSDGSVVIYHGGHVGGARGDNTDMSWFVSPGDWSANAYETGWMTEGDIEIKYHLIFIGNTITVRKQFVGVDSNMVTVALLEETPPRSTTGTIIIFGQDGGGALIDDVAVTTILSNPIDDGECGGPLHPYPAMDFSENCVVNMSDFAIFAADWMEDTRP